jgi:hypothetical protein
MATTSYGVLCQAVACFRDLKFKVGAMPRMLVDGRLGFEVQMGHGIEIRVSMDKGGGPARVAVCSGDQVLKESTAPVIGGMPQIVATAQHLLEEASV